VVVLGLTAACTARAPSTPAYTPRTRDVTITAVPLLTKEMAAVYPFLREDFAPGGVLDGKEVYTFMPSTVTVVEGDTVHFTFVNPEDDKHLFTMADLSVTLPGQTITSATYVARHAGIYRFVCDIPAHLPMMWGQLVVLTPKTIGAH